MPELSPGINYRWPRKGDRLLRNSDDWSKAVNFSEQPLLRHAQIWSGYMRAGDALIDVCDREPSERNELIYPILFSYRHGLEMAMKWIVSRYGRSSGVPAPEQDHNLWHLWRSCKTILEFSCPDPDRINEVVEKIVKEFHDLQRAGLSFRYSVNEHRALYPLPEGLLDLANLRDVMKGVAHFFDGTDAVLDDLKSWTDSPASDIVRLASETHAAWILLGFHRPVLGANFRGGTVHEILEAVDDLPISVGVVVNAYEEPPAAIAVVTDNSAHGWASLDLAGHPRIHSQGIFKVSDRFLPDASAAQ